MTSKRIPIVLRNDVLNEMLKCLENTPRKTRTIREDVLLKILIHLRDNEYFPKKETDIFEIAYKLGIR